MRADKIALLLLVLAVLPAAAPAQDGPVVLRFSHVVGESTPKGLGALMFKRLAEQRLAGKVRVEVHPSSRKYTDDQALVALLFGDIELAAPSFAKFRGFTKALQVFDLPFLFPDVAAVHRFQASPDGRKLLDSMAPRGIKGLTFWDNGMRVMSANRPLRKPGDVRGLTFRIEPSAVFEEQHARLGAYAIPMPFKQVVQAVKEGWVDGQENAWSNIDSRALYKYQRHFTELGHTFLGYMVVTNTVFWEGLPAPLRGELETILAEVTAEVNRLALEKAEQGRQKVLAAGREVIAPSADELKAWRAALDPVRQKFEAEIGPQIVKAAAGGG